MSISVWVLIFYLGKGPGGGPIVIDNIESEKECEWVATKIGVWTPDADNFKCVRVVKAITNPD